MSFLLDTNVISEPMRARPNPGVLDLLARVDEDRVFLSVVTIAELRYGIERLAAGKPRTGSMRGCARISARGLKGESCRSTLGSPIPVGGLWREVNRWGIRSNLEMH